MRKRLTAVDRSEHDLRDPMCQRRINQSLQLGTRQSFRSLLRNPCHPQQLALPCRSSSIAPLTLNDVGVVTRKNWSTLPAFVKMSAGSSKLPSTILTFGFSARRFAEGESAERVKARICTSIWARRRAAMTAPPCLPVAPETRIVVGDMLKGREQTERFGPE